MERKKLTRIDSYSLHDSLTQVAAGRVDFTQTNSMSFRSMAQQPTLAGKFVSVAVPGEVEFWRHILIGKRNADLAQRLRAIVNAMPDDPQWHTIVERYMLKRLQPTPLARRSSTKAVKSLPEQ